ncbi:MAG: SCP2 sterol-binding domain-containing protein [Candidatus Thermoplasmatota archaeon]|jgi:putative sterol carrier protein|nr:SCP2 sterol-binding domain-containing protein [Candidatus Thermoplasmatota archaeon]MCL5794652.1 SCP2 sterol-binding domain-containing protein [Candidatus Thermoplasmatota archaeon]
MPVFPSNDWVNSFVEEINRNRKYEDTAKDWEGDFNFVVEKDQKFHETVYIYLDLYHGKCRRGGLYAAGEAPKAAFYYSGPYQNWVRLINGEFDPLKAVLVGKFKLKGSMMKIMRYTAAAKELVRTANLVDTQFE